jgi:hypothetical protein
VRTTVLAFLVFCGLSASAAGVLRGNSVKGEDAYPIWRAAASRTLAARGDADSLATAAALTFAGSPSRSKADASKAATAALEFAVRSSELAPGNPAISWLRLQLCANAPGCDIRDAATTMRWVDADNGAAWLPLLALAQKDKDATEVDRILNDMAQGARFDLYANRATVLMFDALKKVRASLPEGYLRTDMTRFTEAAGLTSAAFIPPFSPLINACRDAAAERRETCLSLAKTLQRADTVMAQLVGFAIERRLTPGDGKEVRALADRRHLLEWRVGTANQEDAIALASRGNVRARSRLAAMRKHSREEDADLALLRERKMPLEPPEDHR